MFPRKIFLVAVLLLSVILAGCEIFVFYSLRTVIDAVQQEQYDIFKSIVLIMLVIILLDGIIRYLRARWAGMYAEGGIKVLRELVGRHTMHLPVKEIDKRHSGDMLTRLNNDMNLVRVFSNATLMNVIHAIVGGVLALILLVILHWKLTLVCTIGIPLILLLSALASAPLAKYTRHVQESRGVVNSNFQDTVTGIEVARAFNLQKILGEKFSKAVDEFVLNGFKVTLARAVLLFINIVTGVTPFLLSFGFGGYWVIQGELTPGALLAFVNLLNPLAGPVAQLPMMLGEFRAQMEGANRIFEILDVAPEREGGEKFETKLLSAGNDIISFKNVSFAYTEEGEKIINNMNFNIQTGEKVAIVGPSGSGKTTIIKLLQGYYDHFEGEVNLLGQSIRDWDLKEMRNYISLVSQDTYLFPGTIEENIGYGKIGETSGKIFDAAKAANAHEFISKLKDGYQSSVGEFGDKLSGGQKQRISIARAILKEVPLLLLDEATSALDTHSEYLVQKTLDELLNQDKTALIIAHRLSTIKKADRIIVVDEGQVVETGTHDELLLKDGVYKKLYLRQLSHESQQKEAVV